MTTTVKTTRPTIHTCPVGGEEFRAKKRGEARPSAKTLAEECAQLPIGAFDFKVGDRVVFKVTRNKNKKAGYRARYSRLVREPIYVVVDKGRERRGGLGNGPRQAKPAHVNVYMLEPEGQPNSAK